jgi:DNA-binding NtrC family response regulator
VLIVGPLGSGRQHVAKTIHYSRPAAVLGPLVPIDCNLLDAEEMQATLTSLLRRQAESASEKPSVALLLDVDRLREGAQQELAGFLELPKIELRTIATARTSLQRLAARRRFHRGLAYGLSTLTIALPSLAARADDIPLLAQFFLEEFNADGNRQLAGFAPQALDELAAYPWPHNVAELADLVRQACERAGGREVQAADLPERIRLASGAVAHAPRDEQPIDLDQFLAGVEKELTERALKLARNNKTRAAELLGVNRARLLRRLVQLGLAPPPAEEEPVVFEPVSDEPPLVQSRESQS